MGQVNSSLDSDSTNQVSPAVADSDHVKSDSPKSDSSEVEKNKVKIDSIHCVKSRIDMLIEDCLNIKDSSNDCGDKSPVVIELESKDENSAMSERSKTPEKAEEVEGKGDATQEVKQNKECQGSASDSKSVSPDAGLNAEDDSKSNTTVESVKHLNVPTMSRTTFQTFIDKVLDSSLKEDGGLVTNCTTNILELCNESMPPAKIDSEKIVDKKQIEAKSEASASSDDAKNDSKQSTKIHTSKKVTLKDHIERFLEFSFRNEDNRSDEKLDVETKTSIPNGKSEVQKNRSDQDMMKTGIQIMNLLNPEVSKSKDTDKGKNCMSQYERNRDSQTKEWLKKMVEVGQQSRGTEKPHQFEKRSHPYEVNHRGGAQFMHKDTIINADGKQFVRQKTNPYHVSSHVLPKSGFGMPPRDANHLRDGYAQMPNVKDAQDVRFADSKYNESRYEPGYRDQVVETDKREMTFEYAQVAQKQDTGSYYPQRPEVRLGHAQASPEHVQPQMLYSSQYSQRNVSAPTYPPGVYQGKSSPGHIYEQPSPGGRPVIGIPHVRQPHPDTQDVRSVDIHKPPRSPNLPRQMVPTEMPLSRMPMMSPVEQHPSSAIRGMHGAHSSGLNSYPNVAKPVPHHTSVSTHKDYPGMAVTPSYQGRAVAQQGRRGSVPDNKSPYLHSSRIDDHNHVERMEQYSRSPNISTMDSKMSEGVEYDARPSSLPSQDYRNTIAHDMQCIQAMQGASMHNSETGRRDFPSKHSDTSNDAPLDLSVKVTKSDSQFKSAGAGGTFQTSAQHRKLNPSNTFIKHLENSVDRYCQELISPSGSPPVQRHQRQQQLRSDINLANEKSYSYSQQSPPGVQSQPGPFAFQSRPLPSPHFSGGITMGQPLVNNKIPVMAPQQQQQQQQQPRPRMDYHYSDSNSQTPPSVQQQTQAPRAPMPSAQANFDPKRNMNNVSKHEPIQSIIGNHDPNDILYLICTLCTQTYGSPYGFRKHFRNQHGFEPRAEHTIVQTISATKTALQLPGQGPSQHPGDGNPGNPSAASLEAGEIRSGQGRFGTCDVDRDSNSSSPTNNSVKSNVSTESDKSRSQRTKPLQKDDDVQTKSLVCPECGKAFQLNDFGSYKRHCRQHGQLKTSGPFSCSNCHMSFPDQKLLKEHGVVHSESQGQAREDRKVSSDEMKPTEGQATLSCTKCDKRFDDPMLLKSHMIAHDQPPTLSPQGQVEGKQEQSPQTSVSDSSSTTADKKWPDITLSVIPSRNIVKQEAESMTSLACPDSSWDSRDKECHASDDKCDDSVTEISDSGYSSSVGSNCTVTNEDKFGEKSPAEEKPKQKSAGVNNEAIEDKNSEEDMEVYYKHKKFFLHRKRDNSVSSNAVEAPVSKQPKLSNSSSSSSLSNLETNTPVSSSIITTDNCDSSVVLDCKESAQKSPKSNGMDTKSVASPKQQLKDTSSSTKPEARHNLPFVWDRTTRSQRQTK